jgi:hypothetical protein
MSNSVIDAGENACDCLDCCCFTYDCTSSAERSNCCLWIAVCACWPFLWASGAMAAEFEGEVPADLVVTRRGSVASKDKDKAQEKKEVIYTVMNQFTSPFGDNYNMEIYAVLSRRPKVIELCGAENSFILYSDRAGGKDAKTGGAVLNPKAFMQEKAFREGFHALSLDIVHAGTPHSFPPACSTTAHSEGPTLTGNPVAMAMERG